LIERFNDGARFFHVDNETFTDTAEGVPKKFTLEYELVMPGEEGPDFV
jgi:hypothetical protein